MSASPFNTIEEFNGVLDGPTEGAIYTFAHNPSLNAIALLASVALFIWFLVRTYATHHNVPKMDKSLNNLSMLITVGLLSLVSAEFRQFRQPTRPATTADAQIQSASPRSSIPVALLGLAGIGTVRRRSKPRRRQHSGTRRFR